MISIIIPTLNESELILNNVQNLQRIRNQGLCEIIIIDGKSQDDTCSLIRNLVDKLVIIEPKRASQLNAGGDIAKGDILLFLHADTYISEKNIIELENNKTDFHWGFFPLGLSQNSIKYKLLEKCINLRSYFFNCATGDQGIFMKNEIFKRINGFPDIELMEDLEVCKLLKEISEPLIIKSKIITSARKWEKDGFYLTVLKMRLFRILYSLGLSAKILHKYY